MLHHLRFISVSRKVCKHFSHFIIKQVPAKMGARQKRDLSALQSHASNTPAPPPPSLSLYLYCCCCCCWNFPARRQACNICTVMNFCNKLCRNFSLTNFFPFCPPPTPTGRAREEKEAEREDCHEDAPLLICFVASLISG